MANWKFVWILGSSIRQQKKSLSFAFFHEVLNNIAGYETYSFLDGHLRYHQIFIALETRYKTNFVTD